MGKELIIALITAIFGPLIVILTKYYFTIKKRKNDYIKNTLHNSEQIVHKLEEIKEDTKADRVWVTQFHNGGTFYPTGKSITKFSVVFEVVAPSVSSIQQNFQNIPVSLFPRCLNHLHDNNTILIPDFKDETVATYGLKYVAEESGCKSNYLFAIKTIEGKFIGVLGLDFVRKKTTLNDDQIGTLKVESSLIGGVLIK